MARVFPANFKIPKPHLGKTRQTLAKWRHGFHLFYLIHWQGPTLSTKKMITEDCEIVNHLQQTHLIHSNGHLKQLLLKIIEAMRILRPISCSMMAETLLFILVHLMEKSIQLEGQEILSFQRQEIQIVLLFIFLHRQYQKTYYPFQLFRTQTVTPW